MSDTFTSIRPYNLYITIDYLKQLFSLLYVFNRLNQVIIGRIKAKTIY